MRQGPPNPEDNLSGDPRPPLQKTRRCSAGPWPIAVLCAWFASELMEHPPASALWVLPIARLTTAANLHLSCESNSLCTRQAICRASRRESHLRSSGLVGAAYDIHDESTDRRRTAEPARGRCRYEAEGRGAELRSRRRAADARAGPPVARRPPALVPACFGQPVGHEPPPPAPRRAGRTGPDPPGRDARLRPARRGAARGDLSAGDNGGRAWTGRGARYAEPDGVVGLR